MLFARHICNTEWPTLRSVLLQLYPDSGREILSYKQAFEQLSKLDHRIGYGRIGFRFVRDPDESYWEVYGYKGQEQFALDFVPWQQVLGMDVDTSPRLTDMMAITHVFKEITFYAFSQGEITKMRDEVFGQVSAVTYA